MTTNRMGLEQEDDYGLSAQLEVLEAMTAPGDAENQQLICLLLELKRRRANIALDDAERAELLAYREASKKAVAWTDAEELRDANSGGCGYLFPIGGSANKFADPRRQIMLYAAPAVTVPDGWQLVPIEPTENMVVEGFESEPDSFFSNSDEWEAYKAMSGCQQAAHKAKLCWAAMIAAAPSVTNEP